MTPAPTQEIEDAVAHHGLRPRRILLVSPLLERKGRRLAYRVDNEDGQTFKLRQFESADVARSIVELRAGLEEAFAPALARYGSVVVEEWVDGVMLTDLDADEWAAEAGALLGRLHAQRLSSDAPSTVSTRKWRDGAESDLEMLGTADQLAPDEVARLGVQLRQGDPLDTPATLIHLDFCAENLLIDLRGRLRVIDNEQLAIEPAGLDLGRTFHRWPMPGSTWTRFRRGYLSSAPGEPGATGFWRIVAALVGARVFFQRDSPARLEASLALLRCFAKGESLSEPTLP